MYQFIKNISHYGHLGSALFIAALSVSTLSHAQYQDPLDTPAIHLPMAKYALLLDVTDTGKHLVAVGERGHILYSTDTGINWQQAQVPVQIQLNAVTFIDENYGWAVGEDAVILHSQDGGLNWLKQFDDRDSDIAGPLLDVYFKDALEGFAIGVFNKLYHTKNGGSSWQVWQEHADNLDEWHLFALTSPTPEVFYVASEAGLLFRSKDGGESFNPVKTGHEGSFHGVLAQRGNDGIDRLVLSGVGGIIYTSLDGGDTWQKLNSHTEAGLSGGTFLPDGSVLVVGADGIMLRISADLSRVHKMQRDNGLPLSNVLLTADKKLILVGLGGVQTLKLSEVLGHE